MKITLESTDKFVTVNSVPARVWEGRSESGVPCFAFITRIGVPMEADASQFQRELEETPAVRAEMANVFPTRLVL